MSMEPDDVTNELSWMVIGAAIEVHRVLGPGFLESVYEEALALEIGAMGIPFERQHDFKTPVLKDGIERVVDSP